MLISQQSRKSLGLTYAAKDPQELAMSNRYTYTYSGQCVPRTSTQKHISYTIAEKEPISLIGNTAEIKPKLTRLTMGNRKCRMYP
jgi:hypothetical protein